MIWLKRILTWTIRLVGTAMAAAIALTILVILVGGFSRTGSQFLADRIAAVVSTDNRQIAIIGTGPLLSSAFSVETITLSDVNGIYATIDDLSVDWTPGDLIRLRFTADRIAAKAIAVIRPPAPSAVARPETQEPFSLPVEIDIRTLDLPSIQLGSALVRRDMALSAQGSLQIVDDTIASRLTATRKDAPGNSAVADLLYAPNENQLRIKLDYREAAQGLLGTLLQVPGAPALSLSVDGDGPLNDWAGKITAALNDAKTIEVDATHRLDDTGTRQLTAKGGGSFESLMPPELRDIFTGQTSIDLIANLGQDGAFTIETGTLRTASVTVSASGRYNPTGENDIRLQAVALGEPVLIASRGPAVTGDMRLRQIDLALSGQATAAVLTAVVDLASLSSSQGQLTDVKLAATSEAFNLATRQGPVDLALAVKGAAITDPEIARYIRAPLRLSAPLIIEEQGISFEQLTLESDGLDVTGNGRYALDTQSFAGRLQMNAVPDLLPPTIAAKLSGPIALSARVDYTAPKAIALREIDLATDIGTAQGSFSLDQSGMISSDLTGQIRDLGSFVDRITGAADFNLSADGQPDALKATINLAVSEGEAAGYRIDNLALSIDGIAARTAPSGTVRLTGQIDGKPVNATGQLVSANGSTSVSDLALDIGPNRLTGALSLDANLAPSGTLDFDMPDLSLLTALAGQTLSGDLKGRAALLTNAGATSATIQAAGARLQQGAVLIENPAADLTISDIGALNVEGSVTATAVASGANRVESVKLDFARRATATDFTLTARYDNAPAQVTGSLTQTPQGLAIGLDRLQAAPRGLALTLGAPTSITLAEGGIRIGETIISAGSGRITVSGFVGDQLEIAADINALPAALANAFAPQLAPEGRVSGRVTVSGTSAAPIADYRLDWQGAALAQTRALGLGPLGVTANGRFENQRLTLESRVSGAGIALATTGTLSLETGPGLNLRVEGTVPLAAVNGQLAAQGLVAEGTANVSLAITGTAAEPNITGTISTNAARVVDVRRNLAIEQINTSVNLTGSRAEIRSLTGNFTTGGRVTASGSIDLRGAGLPADLTITLDQAVYVDGSTVTSTADAQLTLRGPLLNGPTLGGAVNLARTSITLSESKPNTLQALDIEHRHAPPEILRQQSSDQPAQGRSSSAPIMLDLRVSSPTQTFIRGRGIDAELGGTIVLTGTAAAPNVSGAFELRRGRMQILTRRLDITKARITFGGDLVPLLDLEATTASGNTTIVIRLTGLASNPEVSFTSSPALPQDEILAQLIFGQSMARLSALQIAQLADAASQLAGGRGTSLFQSLRSTLGIDDLDISTDETGGTSISAGKYLNDRTYIELQQSGSSGAKAVINLDIGRGVKLKGEAGGSGAGGGIFYEKEY